jgi:hypothetical protein
MWLAARTAGAAVAVDDFFLGIEGGQIGIPFTALLANDNLDGPGHWEVVLASVPARGNLQVDLHGFVYKPAAGAWGLETFTYFLTSGRSSSNTATVRLQISPLWAPVAGDWDGDGDIEVGAVTSCARAWSRGLSVRSTSRSLRVSPDSSPSRATGTRKGRATRPTKWASTTP